MTGSFVVLTMALLTQAPGAVAAPAPSAGTGAVAGKMLAVDASRSTLTYDITHKLHKVHAESKAVEGKVMLLPDGKVQVMLRAPVASFNSGDANRDSHMQETVEAQKFPYVTFKGVTRLIMPAAFPATAQLDLEGVIDFHGRKQPITIPAKLDWAANGEAHVTASFPVSLDSFEVERPSLLLMKIDDACVIGANLTLKEEAR